MPYARAPGIAVQVVESIIIDTRTRVTVLAKQVHKMASERMSLVSRCAFLTIGLKSRPDIRLGVSWNQTDFLSGSMALRNTTFPSDFCKSTAIDFKLTPTVDKVSGDICKGKITVN